MVVSSLETAWAMIDSDQTDFDLRSDCSITFGHGWYFSWWYIKYLCTVWYCCFNWYNEAGIKLIPFHILYFQMHFVGESWLTSYFDFINIHSNGINQHWSRYCIGIELGTSHCLNKWQMTLLCIHTSQDLIDFKHCLCSTCSWSLVWFLCTYTVNKSMKWPWWCFLYIHLIWYTDPHQLYTDSYIVIRAMKNYAI